MLFTRLDGLSAEERRDLAAMVTNATTHPSVNELVVNVESFIQSTLESPQNQTIPDPSCQKRRRK